MRRIPSRLFATANRKRTADNLKPNEPLSPVSMIRIPSRLFAKANRKRIADKLKPEAPPPLGSMIRIPPRLFALANRKRTADKLNLNEPIFPSAASLQLKNTTELFIICTWLHEKQRLYARLVRLATKMKSYAI